MDENKYWNLRKGMDSLTSSPGDHLDTSEFPEHYLKDSLCPEVGNTLAHKELLKRHGKSGVHVVVDINGLSHLNQKFGNEAGDSVIKELCESASKIAHSNSGKVFRTSGGELSGHFGDPDAATRFASELNQSMDGKHLKGHKISACFGLGYTHDQAKEALKHAKDKLGPVVEGERVHRFQPHETPSQVHHFLDKVPPEEWGGKLAKAYELKVPSIPPVEIKSPTAPSTPKAPVAETQTQQTATSSKPKKFKTVAPQTPTSKTPAPGLPKGPPTQTKIKIPLQDEVFQSPPPIPADHVKHEIDHSWIDGGQNAKHDTFKHEYNPKLIVTKKAEDAWHSSQTQNALKQFMAKLSVLCGNGRNNRGEYNNTNYAIPGVNLRHGVVGTYDHAGEILLDPKHAHGAALALGAIGKIHGDAIEFIHNEHMSHVGTLIHEMFHAATHRESPYHTPASMALEEGTTEILAQHYTPYIFRHFNAPAAGEEHLKPLFTFDAQTGKIKTTRTTVYADEIANFANFIGKAEGLAPNEALKNPNLSQEERQRIEAEDSQRITNAIVNHALKSKQYGNNRIEYMGRLLGSRTGETIDEPERVAEAHLGTMYHQNAYIDWKENIRLKGKDPQIVPTAPGEHIKNEIDKHISSHLSHPQIQAHKPFNASLLKKHIIDSLHESMFRDKSGKRPYNENILSDAKLGDMERYIDGIDELIDEKITSHPNLRTHRATTNLRSSRLGVVSYGGRRAQNIEFLKLV